MRKQRIAMVQTKEQYVLVHQAVRELFREQLRMIDSHPYENIDSNGLPLIKCPSPEPTYDTISSFHNNKSDEKQDEKEKKEQAPPLPQKKRVHTLSSKQAKEVENQSERQRLVEQASSSGPRPRIATLRSLFERQHMSRDTRQVARSHSLGSTRHPKNSPQQGLVEAKEQPPQKPIPGKGILRVPQPQQVKPALPVKRSKSLRVLGSGDRSKLSIPNLPPETSEPDAPRRLSLESNFDEIKDLVNESTHQTLTDCLSVDSIIAGLGVRERRNSFRQAVRRESHESSAQWPKKPGLLRSYTSVDMRSAREKPALALDKPPNKPILRPKPNLQFDSHAKLDVSKKLPTDRRQHFQNHSHSSVNQHYSALGELKKSQSQASSSRTLMTHSMSLRLAPKSRREDCRVLMSPSMPRPDMSHFSEQIHSSGESTVSASSDQSMSNKQFTPSTSRLTVQTPSSSQKSDSEGSDKQSRSVPHHTKVTTPRRQERISSSYRKESLTGLTGLPRDQGQMSRQHQTPSTRSDQKPLLYESVKTSDSKKNPPLPNYRPVVYESRGVRQNQPGIYGTVLKAPPPPYIEPGKNAQKPRSSPQSHQQNNGGYYEDIYNRPHLQRHCPSSRDMVLPSHKPNLTGLDTRLTSTENPGIGYPKHVEERKQNEHDYKFTASDIYAERKSGTQELRFLSHESSHLHGNERRYQVNETPSRGERQLAEQRNLVEGSSQNPQDRRHIEQTSRQSSGSSSKQYSERRPPDKNFQMPSQEVKANSHEQESKFNQHDQYYRSLGEKRVGTQEYRLSPQELSYKTGDRRSNDQELFTSPESSFPSTNERRFADQEHRSGPQDAYAKAATNYPPNSQDLYSKLPMDRRTDAKAAYINNRPSRPHDQAPRTPRPSSDGPTDDRPINEVETPVSQGVKMRRGSRDDLALCGTTPSRVKRHASVVLLRHSLIQDSSSPSSPLSVWAQGGDQAAAQAIKQDDPWSGSVGVDVDQVAASITSKKDDKMMRAALEALHLRKASQSTPKSTPTSHKGGQVTPKTLQNPPKSSQSASKVAQNTPKQSSLPVSGGEVVSKAAVPPPQYQPPPEAKPGPFRKQQQYL